jgi:prepilin-type N-terminal cleavage/methylation domain-containing protein
MKKNKGFTLIELLVVIAIIGILASVVLASLNSARQKGADAAIKSNLNNARAQAELFYDSNGQSYQDASGHDVCNKAPAVVTAADNATLGIGNMLIGAQSAYDKAGSQVMCDSSATAWVAYSPLKSDTANVYCVDSTGKSVLLLATAVASSAPTAATGCR